MVPRHHARSGGNRFAGRQRLRRLFFAVTALQVLKHVARNHSAANEPGALPHHLDQNVLGTLIESGDRPEINDQLMSFMRFPLLFPCPLQFADPRFYELPADYQHPPILGIHGNYL
jgi:hypothetical protein